MNKVFLLLSFFPSESPITENDLNKCVNYENKHPPNKYLLSSFILVSVVGIIYGGRKILGFGEKENNSTTYGTK